VHQDGLVHVSHLADQFVSDPRQVVKAGQVVKVRVLEVDLPRKRISLSMRSDVPVQGGKPSGESARKETHGPKPQKKDREAAPKLQGAMADAWAKAVRK